jgi:hypothetical protein
MSKKYHYVQKQQYQPSGCKKIKKNDPYVPTILFFDTSQSPKTRTKPLNPYG